MRSEGSSMNDPSNSKHRSMKERSPDEESKLNGNEPDERRWSTK